MKKRRSLLFGISGILLTGFGHARAVKNFSNEQQALFVMFEGTIQKIPVHKKIVFIDLPPNKYFKVKVVNLDGASADSTNSYSLRMPCAPTKPLKFILGETNIVFIIYPKGRPWPNKKSMII